MVEGPEVFKYERQPIHAVIPLASSDSFTALGMAAGGPTITGTGWHLEIWKSNAKGVPQKKSVELPRGFIATGVVRDLLVLPGRQIAVALQEGGLSSPASITFFDLATLKVKGNIPLQLGETKARSFSGASRSLVSSPDEKTLAALTTDGVFLVNVGERKIERLLPGAVWTVDFSPDGRQLLYVQDIPSTSQGEENVKHGKAMTVVETATGQRLAETREDVGIDTKFSPDGTLIARATSDGIMLRKAKDLQIIVCLKGSGGNPRCLAFAPTEGPLQQANKMARSACGTWIAARKWRLLQLETVLSFTSFSLRTPNAFATDAECRLRKSTDGVRPVHRRQPCLACETVGEGGSRRTKGACRWGAMRPWKAAGII